MHEMRLQSKYFEYILNGTKRIELRLNDEKCQLIKIGDTIKFIKEPELEESFNAKVIGLLKYNSFNDLFKDYSIDILANRSMIKSCIRRILYQRKTRKIWSFMKQLISI